WPLSYVSATGRLTPSVPEPCCFHTVSGPGMAALLPAAATQPNSAKNVSGAPDGENSTIGGDFGSTSSRYCVNVRSSIRPPLRSMLPPSRGVSMGMRGEDAITAWREAVCGCPDGVAGNSAVAGGVALGCEVPG